MADSTSSRWYPIIPFGNRSTRNPCSRSHPIELGPEVVFHLAHKVAGRLGDKAREALSTAYGLPSVATDAARPDLEIQEVVVRGASLRS